MDLIGEKLSEQKAAFGQKLSGMRRNFANSSNEKLIKARKHDRRKVSDSLGVGFKSGKLTVSLKINFKEDLEITIPKVRILAGQQKLAGTLVGEIAEDEKDKMWHERGEIDFGDFEFHLFPHMYPKVIDIDVVEAMMANSMSRKVVGLFNNDKSEKKFPDPLTIQLPADKDIESGTIVEKDFTCDVFGLVKMKAVYAITDPNAGNNDDLTEFFRSELTKAHGIDDEDDKKRAQAFATEHPQVNGIQILLVPGLFTEYYPGYYSKNLNRLNDMMGVETRVSLIDTAAGCATNADVLKEEINEMHLRFPSKKLVIYGHSKGGCDIALALIKYPELQEHMYGVITMQAPYNGSYMIDWVVNNPVDKAATKVVETLFAGEKAAYEDLAYPSRKAIREQYEFDGRKIPTVNMCTYGGFELKKENLDTINELAGLGSMRFCHDVIMKAVGTKNDGMVAPADGRMPGASLVYLENMYHTEPAMQMPGTEYKNGALSQALLACLLEKISREGTNTT